MQGEIVHDEVGVARRGERLQPIQKVQPGGGIAGGGGLDEHRTGPVRKRTKRPAIAVARVVGTEMRTMRSALQLGPG